MEQSVCQSATARRHRAVGEMFGSKIAWPATQVHGRGTSPAVFIRMGRFVDHLRSVGSLRLDAGHTRRQAIPSSEAANRLDERVISGGRLQAASRSPRNRGTMKDAKSTKGRGRMADDGCFGGPDEGIGGFGVMSVFRCSWLAGCRPPGGQPTRSGERRSSLIT